MSRTRKTLIRAAFTYSSFAIGIARAFIVIPMILRHVGLREYGLWLASGELLAYLTASDLGVFVVMPWLIANADGAGDKPAVRQYLSNGRAIGVIASATIALAAMVVVFGLPRLLVVASSDYHNLVGPLAVLAVGTALGFSLKLYSSLLTGLQDVVYVGWIEIAKAIASIVLTVVMLLSGYGLWGLAISMVTPMIAAGLACVIRSRFMYGSYLSDWPRATWSESLKILNEGFGAWMASLGVQLFAASNGIIMTILGHPEWAPVFFCTAKLFQVSEQLGYVLPDSGLIALAQLHGEQLPSRVRDVVASLLRLTFFLGMSSATLLLAINGTFVTWWVGEELFAGQKLNILLALAMITMSAIHGLTTTVATVGNRRTVGTAAILHGIVYVTLALFLGSTNGLPGLVIAGIASSVLVTLPVCLCLHRSVFGLTPSDIVLKNFATLLLRGFPFLLMGGTLGIVLRADQVWLLVVAVCFCGLAYGWWMRPLISQLPIPAPWEARLAKLRLTVRQAA